MVRDRAMRGIIQGQAAYELHKRSSVQWLMLSSLLPAESQTHSLRTTSLPGLPCPHLCNHCSKVSGSNRALSAQVLQASPMFVLYAEDDQILAMKTFAPRSKRYNMRWSPRSKSANTIVYGMRKKFVMPKSKLRRTTRGRRCVFNSSLNTKTHGFRRLPRAVSTSVAANMRR